MCGHEVCVFMTSLVSLLCFAQAVGSMEVGSPGRYMVPVLVAYTASAPVVEITVPVPVAYAGSGPLIENVVPRVGCNGNTAEEEEKKEEKVRKTSLLPNKFVCAIKTNLLRTCVEMFVEINQKIEDLKKSFVQVRKCVNRRSPRFLSNRTKIADVLRFSTSKIGMFRSS